MKANRNQKINRICRKLYSKYRKNVISLVTAAVLLVTSMPLADISGVVSKWYQLSPTLLRLWRQIHILTLLTISKWRLYHTECRRF